MGAERHARPARAPGCGLLVIVLAAALYGNEAREVHTLRGLRLSAWEEPPSEPAVPASPAITPEQAADLRAEVDAAAAAIRADHGLPAPAGEVVAVTPAPAPAQAVQAQAQAPAPPAQAVPPDGGGLYRGFHESSSAVDGLLIVAKASRAEEEQRCAALKQSQQEAIAETNRRIRQLAADAAAAPERLAAAQTEIEFITIELQRGQEELSNHMKRCAADNLLFESQLKNVARHKAIMERMLRRANCSSVPPIPNCLYLRNHLQSLRTGVDAKRDELELQLNASRVNCSEGQTRREEEMSRLQAGLKEHEENIRILTGATDTITRRAALNDEMREHHEEFATTLQGCMQRVGAYDEEVASLEMLKADLDRLVPHTAVGPPSLQAAGQQQAAPPPPAVPAAGASAAAPLPPVAAAQPATPQPVAAVPQPTSLLGGKRR